MLEKSSTKKKIFIAAVNCFSSKGYKQCSMNELAAVVGIRASSLYKHFKNKEEILHEIFEYYKINFNKYRTPIEKVLEAAESKDFLEIIPMLFFYFGTESEQGFMMKISRIVVDLRFENKEAQKLYKTVFFDEATDYLHTVFTELIKSGKVKPFNYEAVSFQFMGFTHMLFSMAFLDGVSKKEIERRYVEGIELFARGLGNARLFEQET